MLSKTFSAAIALVTSLDGNYALCSACLRLAVAGNVYGNVMEKWFHHYPNPHPVLFEKTAYL